MDSPPANRTNVCLTHRPRFAGGFLCLYSNRQWRCAMQTIIRYSVVNQDGRAVIRAVPVRRCAARSAPRPELATEPRQGSLRRVIRRLRQAR